MDAREIEFKGVFGAVAVGDKRVTDGNVVRDKLGDDAELPSVGVLCSEVSGVLNEVHSTGGELFVALGLPINGEIVRW